MPRSILLIDATAAFCCANRMAAILAVARDLLSVWRGPCGNAAHALSLLFRQEARQHARAAHDLAHGNVMGALRHEAKANAAHQRAEAWVRRPAGCQWR